VLVSRAHDAAREAVRSVAVDTQEHGSSGRLGSLARLVRRLPTFHLKPARRDAALPGRSAAGMVFRFHERSALITHDPGPAPNRTATTYTDKRPRSGRTCGLDQRLFWVERYERPH
jgi:hypothetical protein